MPKVSISKAPIISPPKQERTKPVPTTTPKHQTKIHYPGLCLCCKYMLVRDKKGWPAMVLKGTEMLDLDSLFEE